MNYETHDLQDEWHGTRLRRVVPLLNEGLRYLLKPAMVSAMSRQDAPNELSEVHVKLECLIPHSAWLSQ